jgi:hypothetical protein
MSVDRPYAAAMGQPSPEDWWSTLSDSDRAAYLDAAPKGIIGFVLWNKLSQANIVAWARAVEDQPWEYRMPGPYLAYVRARAAERTNPGA